MIKAYFDGLCAPVNPGGIACYGFVIYKDGKKIHEDSDIACEPYAKEATNNLAEYTGCLRALEYLINSGLNDLKTIIYGDSRLVIEQLNGRYKIKSKNLVDLYAKIRVMIMEFKDLELQWVPREQNKEADAMCNVAYTRNVDRDRRT